MDQERARTLLEEERRRLEQLQASIAADQDRVTADTNVAEDLVDGATRRVEEETDEAIARQLDHRLRALQRAEARLAAGSYGRSVQSGQAIPDERLEAFPLAELAPLSVVGPRWEPDRLYLSVGGAQPRIEVFDLMTGQHLHSVTTPSAVGVLTGYFGQ